MRSKPLRPFLCLAAAALLVPPWASSQTANGYLDFAALERQAASLAQANPNLVKLSAIGSSAGNRKLHLLTIAAAGKRPVDQRPAIFVAANIVGFHNAGTQAALALAAALVARKDEPAVKTLLETRTFYIAPALNPDAHDGMFSKLRYRQSLNAGKLDRDLDGLIGEDGFNDLNNDGRITTLRIPDPAGEWMVDPSDARLLRKADPLKGEKGQFRLTTEGIDDDKDGHYNEDPAGGYRPDRNFAHAWNDADPETGPWPSAQPEAHAVMDFCIKHRNIAMAVVFGPANNLLSLPAVDPRASGPQRYPMPRFLANLAGVDATKQYTVDEAYELLKDAPGVLAQGGVTKDEVAGLLATGPILFADTEDVKFYRSFADEYKKLLEKAGLDNKRTSVASAAGGLQNWLYFHYSTFAVEFDVWGVPKSNDKKEAPATEPSADVIAYIDAQAKDAFVPWTAVTLPDGVKAEVGGVDPFVEIAPPAAELNKATAAHTDAVLLMAGKLADVAMQDVQVKALGAGIYEVSATAINNGFLPTATRVQVRTKSFLPARLTITLPTGAKLVQGNNRVAGERIAGSGGTLKGTWLVEASPGARVTVSILTPNAGEDSRQVVLP